MNFVDIIIIIILAFGALVGFKRGFTRQLLSLLGLVVTIVLAFTLKNPLSKFLYLNLPFINFPGKLGGISVINILLYEIIAFVIIFGLLLLIFKVLIMASNVFEKFLNMTIILGIPSKILGAVIGVVENFLVIFAVLYILSLPVFNTSIVDNSKIRNDILTKTPVLNKYADAMYGTSQEFAELLEKYKEDTNSAELNLEALDLFLKHKIITVEAVDILVEKDKLPSKGTDEILEKYR